MTRAKAIFSYISSVTVSLLFALSSHAQQLSLPEMEPGDSIPLFNGFAISVDLVGPIQRLVSDYGQFEAALRVNLRDRYFPIVEVGLGNAKHDDVVTQFSYKSTAPYFRLGMDYNLLKDKHDIYRIYGGGRYALSYFKYDVSHPGVLDPIWKTVAPIEANGEKGHYHWLEFSIGVDAKIWGPFHMGWSVRYRRRLFYDTGSTGNVWYVPGYGESGNTRLGGTFNVGIDL